MKKSHLIELLLFLALLSILTILAVKIFKNTFDIGTTYHLQFTDIDRITIGSPVRILGVDIGHVTKIKTDKDIIYVDFVVPNEKIKLPKGTTATIESFGIAGSRSIELSPPKDSVEGYTTQITTFDPIRLGHAFTIMKDFLRATMVSIGGLYEFAKSKNQDKVESMTHNALNVTNQADDEIVNVTNRIQKAGNTTQDNIQKTTRGMNRIYTETSILNVSQGINIGRYATNLTRRTLVRFNRNIKEFNPTAQKCAAKTNEECKHLQNIDEKAESINKMYKTVDNAEKSMQKVNGILTEENINNIQIKINNIKNKTDNLEKQL